MDIKDIIEAASTLLQQPKNQAIGFEADDIVHLPKHKEQGIVLGRLPLDDLEKVRAQINHQNSIPKCEGSPRLVVLTFSGEDKRFRIRYPYAKDVTLLKGKTHYDTTELGMVKKHCEEQCILECTEECSIYKLLNKGK